MKKLIIINTLICFATQASAWDFSTKADVQKSFTDNVNLTNTNPVSDSYSTFSGYLQTKNDSFKIKLKGKNEKYKSQTVNDNYSFDLSLQYKRTKNNDFTFAVFKQVYDGIPLVVTDTTSDNNGGRLSTTLSKDFDKETSGYIFLNGTYRKYSKLSNRNDKIISGSFGLEHDFNPTLFINPELVISSTNSTDSYYKNTSFGASVLLSYTPIEKWEIYFDGSYSHTSYSARSVTSIVRNRTSTEKEYQDLKSAGIGTIYTFADMFPVQLKYSTDNNSSNNAPSAYNAKIVSFSIGIKF